MIGPSTWERQMSKAFINEDAQDYDDDVDVEPVALPAGMKNYITTQGYYQLRDELDHLMNVERPQVVDTVSWAASNGDRSENGDYIYGKRRLREIDRRRSEEHTSELQSRGHLVCRLL